MDRSDVVLAPGRHRAIVTGQLTRDGTKAIAVSIEGDGFDPEWAWALAADESDHEWQPGDVIRRPFALCVRVRAKASERGDEPPRAQLGLVVRNLGA